VETFKEFRNILLGQDIKVHTDLENLTYKHFNSDRVMRWLLFIEEYAPNLQYIKGVHNVVADALSRLPFTDDGYVEEALVTIKIMSAWQVLLWHRRTKLWRPSFVFLNAWQSTKTGQDSSQSPEPGQKFGPFTLLSWGGKN
jgi:hypothetical protein